MGGRNEEGRERGRGSQRRRGEEKTRPATLETCPERPARRLADHPPLRLEGDVSDASARSRREPDRRRGRASRRARRSARVRGGRWGPGRSSRPRAGRAFPRARHFKRARWGSARASRTGGNRHRAGSHGVPRGYRVASEAHLTMKALSLSICSRETSRRAVEGTPSSSICARRGAGGEGTSRLASRVGAMKKKRAWASPAFASRIQSERSFAPPRSRAAPQDASS
jgi:hypothetical protein